MASAKVDDRHIGDYPDFTPVNAQVRLRVSNAAISPTCFASFPCIIVAADPMIIAERTLDVLGQARQEEL